MSFSGLFYLNSATLQEHDFLAAPSDLESQQVPNAALVPVHAAGGGPHVPDSSLPPPAIASDGLHLPSNSATLAKVSLPAKSGGVTVPTAETTVDGVDAEDGLRFCPLRRSLLLACLSTLLMHVIRYSRMCTNFNKIVRSFMADDEGYVIVSK